MRLVKLGSVGLLLVAGSAGAQQINTGAPSSWYVFPHGAPVFAQFGQTFVAPSGAGRLSTFSFWLINSSNGGALTFDAYVMAWDPSVNRPTGPVLSSTGPHNGTSAGSFQRYDFTSNALVTSGQTYVAFLNAADFINANPGVTAQVGLALTSDGPNHFSTYEGGTFVAAQVLNDANLTSGAWSPVNQWDVSFEANFEPVPEPATIVLLGSGLVGLAGAARRRRMKSSATD